MFGIKVKLTHTLTGRKETEILRNVTEIHYRYPFDKNRVAFESDIHETGITYHIDKVVEFETFPETEKAEAF